MQILVVEDERGLSRALTQILIEQKYKVDAVYNGDDGYAYAVSGIYDLIIMDVMLPGQDGFTVVQKLRQEHVETPILILTARDSLTDKVRGLDIGGDDYMTKPFSPEELLARVRVLSRRRGEVVLDEITRGDLCFTSTTSMLSRVGGERNVHLNFKEAELMRLFLANPARVFPKEELITRVWGYDADVGDNNVEAYISFLRKKLSYIGSKCSLVSLKKVGYRLEVPDAE